MAKKTEVARWKSIMTKLDYKMSKDKKKKKKKVRESVMAQKKGKK